MFEAGSRVYRQNSRAEPTGRHMSIAWFVYEMVVQNMSRTCEDSFCSSFLLQMCASCSEQQCYVRTMVYLHLLLSDCRVIKITIKPQFKYLPLKTYSMIIQYIVCTLDLEVFIFFL